MGKHRDFSEGATIVVAASDSLDKSGAKYICDGVDDQEEIQAAIDELSVSGGVILLLEGSYIKSNIPSITITDDIEIRLKGTITFITDVGDGATIFENDDDTSGNENISIVGSGILDGNKVNQAIGEQVAIKFTKVHNSKVDCHIKNFHGRNIWVVDDIRAYGNKFINREYPDSVEIEQTRRQVLSSAKIEVLDVLDTGWIQQAGTVSHDATTRFSGTHSLKIVTPVGGWGIASKNINVPVDPREYAVGFMIRIENEDRSDVAGVRIRFCDAAGNNYADCLAHQHSLLKDTWILMVPDDFPYATGGAPNYTGFLQVRVLIESSAGKIVTAYFNELVIIRNASPALVTFSLDTQYDSHLDTAKPLFDKHGWAAVDTVVMKPGTGYSIGDPGYLNLAEIRELQTSGWDIINQSWEHLMPTLIPAADITRAEFEDDMRKGQQWLIDHGFEKGSRFYAVNGGFFAQDWQWELASKYNYIVRTIANYPSKSKIQYFDSGYLPAESDLIGLTLDQAKASVDKAIEEGWWVNFYAHESFAILGDLLDYIATKGDLIRVVTYSDVLDNFMFKGIPSKSQHTDPYRNISNEVTNHVVNAQNLAAGSPITCTLVTQPDVPRDLTWIITHAQITEFTIAFVGVDAKGNTITEQVTEATGWSGTLDNAFATVTSITFTRDAGTGAGDTLNVGIGSKLGLSNIIYATADVFKLRKNDVDWAAANWTVDATYHTVDVSTGGAINIGDDFEIYYRSNLNIIG